MEKYLRKFATLAIEVGVNLQKGQFLVVNGDVKNANLVQMIVEEAYKKGARQVFVNYSDEQVDRLHFLNQSEEIITNVPEWMIEQRKWFVDQKMATIRVMAPNPDVFKDVDPSLMQKQRKALNDATPFFGSYSSTSTGQWLGFCIPSLEWAKVMFKDDEDEVAYQKLWDLVVDIVHLNEDNTVEIWKETVNDILRHRQVLTDYAFDRLVFKNSLGTDIEIGLVEDHAWAGGQEMTPEGVGFTPNLPTLEIFCMPHSKRVNGKVVSSKPLNVLGKLVEDFYFVFKDGKVVEHGAKKNVEALDALLAQDEGARHLGEVALIANSSPISSKNVVFFNTAYDENASCHLALGRCYGSNLVDSRNMTKEQMEAKGANFSSIHCDFMFGTPDLEVVGYTKDNQAVTIMKNGEFVI